MHLKTRKPRFTHKITQMGIIIVDVIHLRYNYVLNSLEINFMLKCPISWFSIVIIFIKD